MLLPYNVDRPAHRFPWVTYSLIGVNVLVFFFTLLVANVNLPSDRLLARQAQQQLIQRYLSPDSDRGRIVAAIRAVYPGILPESTPTDVTAQSGAMGQQVTPQQQAEQNFVRSRLSEEEAKQQIQQITELLASQHMNEPGGYDRLWQIQHMNDRVVWEPHYSALDWMAYHPNEPSPWLKLLGLFGSMFLHGGFMHILGNMFFLWVFGRAVEDALGRPIYLGAYLLCGVAAALMQHIITMVFTPAFLGVPLLGASGAISGVLGLFAPRFYRTPVRTFYVLPYALPLMFIVTGIAAVIFYPFLGDASVSIFFGVVLAGTGMYFWGRTWCWGTFKAPAAWWLAFYIFFFNVVPGILGLRSGGGGGVAHWAHIGGFGVGMLYAFLIGSTSEGKNEFGLEDAEKYYVQGDHYNAIAHAQDLVQSAGEQAPALEVLAKSLAAQKKREAAQETFSKAIALYLKDGDRAAAARAYLVASSHFPTFVLPAVQQMIVGSVMESEGDYRNAAATLGKIPVTYPAAPETEMALLRCARIQWLRLGNGEQATVLLTEFNSRYPLSSWSEQAKRLMAQIQKNTS